MENNKNKKSVKFQGDILNFCDFIQVFVFTRNHHLNISRVFFQNMNVTHAATPPAKWITHGYFVIELQTVKLVPTDQPALNILPPSFALS